MHHPSHRASDKGGKQNPSPTFPSEVRGTITSSGGARSAGENGAAPSPRYPSLPQHNAGHRKIAEMLTGWQREEYPAPENRFQRILCSAREEDRSRMDSPSQLPQRRQVSRSSSTPRNTLPSPPPPPTHSTSSPSTAGLIQMWRRKVFLLIGGKLLHKGHQTGNTEKQTARSREELAVPSPSNCNLSPFAVAGIVSASCPPPPSQTVEQKKVFSKIPSTPRPTP